MSFYKQTLGEKLVGNVPSRAVGVLMLDGIYGGIENGVNTVCEAITGRKPADDILAYSIIVYAYRMGD